jgi:uncharacterized membrane protein
VDAGYYMHSFLFRDGDFTTIDFPDSTMTHAYGINSPGDVVGEYRDAAGHWHGFLLHNDNFTQIDYPGSRLTQTWGINASRTITGSYVDSSDKTHAFALDKRGAFTTLDPSFDFTAAYAHGLTPRTDTIVGCWYEGPIMHSLIVRNGEYFTNDFPGSVMSMNWRVNPSGQMVGHYRDSGGRVHGYLFSNSTHASIDFPGGIRTEARGINASGDIVGLYVSPDFVSHGFLLSKQ